MKWLKEAVDRYIHGKPTKAEIVISYTLLGLSIAGLLTVLILVLLHFHF